MINTTYEAETYEELRQEELDFDFKQNNADAEMERDIVNTDAQIGASYWAGKW